MGALLSRRTLRRSAIGALLALAGALAFADPPATVGRVSWLAGEVTLGDADAAPAPAQLNWPVTGGQALSTGATGRAELWAGSDAIRLDVASRLRVEQLDDSALRLRLEQGSVALRIATADASHQASVETPVGRFAPQSAGQWRLDLHGDTLSATSLAGTLALDGAGTHVLLHGGQRADFVLRDGRLSTAFAPPPADDFQNFVRARDAAYDGRVAVRYVSPEMTGVESLDRFGHWEQTVDYGNVWVPEVAPDWAPYRFGHWAWVAPWGWTWVDDAAWGFAPFHYGRWALWHDRWAWVPGAYVARPVYAPALVGWSGGAAPAVSVNLGVGRVAWFPLAPHEVYVPPYAVSATYVRSVNITHVTNITNVTAVAAPAHYAFEADRRARTAVDASVLAEHRAVAHEIAHGAAVREAPRLAAHDGPRPMRPPDPGARRAPEGREHTVEPAREHAFEHEREHGFEHEREHEHEPRFPRGRE